MLRGFLEGGREETARRSPCCAHSAHAAFAATSMCHLVAPAPPQQAHVLACWVGGYKGIVGAGGARGVAALRREAVASRTDSNDAHHVLPHSPQSEVVVSASLGPVVYGGYEQPPAAATITNTGHSLMVRPEQPAPPNLSQQ